MMARSIRDEIIHLRSIGADPAVARKLRARSVADDFMNRASSGNPLIVGNRFGSVRFAGVEFREINDIACVEVWVGDSVVGAPHYRIFNPPTLVYDPQGDIDIGDGQRYREDPIAAVAEVIIGSKR